MLITLPAAFLLKGNAVQVATTGQVPLATFAAIRTALKDHSYLMLAAGFTVCGFHVAFLATHLPGLIASCGLPLQFGAWSLALIGLFNIIGSISVGWAGGKIFEATGSYNWMCYIEIVLAVGAALINFPIREAKLVKAVV